MKGILTLAGSTLWSTASRWARKRVRSGRVKLEKLDARVVSVGNLQVGGGGKTPLVALIAREAHERGMNACILSRGYGSASERAFGAILPGGPPPNPEQMGDEAVLLHDLAPHAAIGVGSQRVAAYRHALEKAGAPFDLVILDDGFQNLQIEKDLDIVALTSARRDEVLYRDWPEEVAHADLVVWTKGEVRPDSMGKPLVRVVYELPPYQAAERKLWLVTGLADGQSVFALGKKLGYPLERHFVFPDHARYTPWVVEQILSDASKAGAKVALTGKDWVKWRSCGVSEAQVLVLEPELKFEEGRDLWLAALWNERA